MKTISLAFAIVSISVFAIGCGDTSVAKNESSETHSEDDGHDGHDHSANDHAAPHGGHLIELGRNHEYHAELVDDHKTESITIYIMDADMKPLSINQSSVSLVLTAGDNTQTFELMSSQPGGSSEFSSNDGKMMEMIEGEDVKGKLRITIDGKPFFGAFDHHEHGHEGEGDSHAGHNHG